MATDVFGLALKLQGVGYKCQVVDCAQKKRLPLLIVKGKFRKRYRRFNWGAVRRANV